MTDFIDQLAERTQGKRGKKKTHGPSVILFNGGVLRAPFVRDRILSAAFAAFTEHGYTQASTLEIATRAKVSKRELYALVGNKQQMLIACIAERSARRLNMPPELPVPRDRETLAIVLEHGAGKKTYEQIAEEHGLTPAALSSRIFEFKAKYTPRYRRWRNRALTLIFLGGAAIAAIVVALWIMWSRPAEIGPDRAPPRPSAVPVPSATASATPEPFEPALPTPPKRPPPPVDKPPNDKP